MSDNEESKPKEEGSAVRVVVLIITNFRLVRGGSRNSAPPPLLPFVVVFVVGVLGGMTSRNGHREAFYGDGTMMHY